MKNTIILFVLALVFLSFSANEALATVGGPTYISRIVHDSQNQAVYYLEHDEGGRDCPAIIHKIDLKTKVDSEVKSCSEAEIMSSESYSSLMGNTFKDFNYLHSINLKKNNISLDIKTISENKDTDGYTMSTDFKMSLFQDKVNKSIVDFKGCSVDDPNTIEGYMVPDSNTLILLISRKRNCFEGGYIGEDLYVVDGINYHDKVPVRTYKDVAPTEPNAGNLVVYPSVEGGEVKNNVSEDKKLNNNNTILVVLVFIVGLMLGYIVKRKV